MSKYRNQLEEFLKQLNIEAIRVLDVGGASNPVSKRVGSFVVDEYVVLDKGVEKPVCEYIPFDLNDEEIPSIGLFDYVFCLEVFEYIYDPVIAIKTLASLVAPGGTLVVSFPFVYPIHNPVEYDFMRYTENGVNKLLEIAGFGEYSVYRRVDASGNLVRLYTADGMHPAKGYDHNVYGFVAVAKK